MTPLHDFGAWLGRRSRLSLMLALGALWLIVASVLWFQMVYKDPENVFNGMLKNNFATAGFTRHVSSNQGGVTSSELSRVQTSAQTQVRTITMLDQQGDKVVTEAISTPEQEYVRYVEIKTQRKDVTGQPLDFSGAVNIWAKAEPNVGELSQAFTQQILGVFPIANLKPEQRAELIRSIERQPAFKADYSQVKKEMINGRQVYRYDVELQAQPYIRMIKAFGDDVGLGKEVAGLNPADYANIQPTRLKVSVDVLSRHLRKVEYSGGDRSEVFSAYGVAPKLELPRQTISSDELQQRLAIPQ